MNPAVYHSEHATRVAETLGTVAVVVVVVLAVTWWVNRRHVP